MSKYDSCKNAFHEPTIDLILDIDDFAKALECVFDDKATILNRMRLACTFYDKDLEKKSKDGDGL